MLVKNARVPMYILSSVIKLKRFFFFDNQINNLKKLRNCIHILKVWTRAIFGGKNIYGTRAFDERNPLSHSKFPFR